MIRHIVLFTWTAAATAEQRAAVTAELRKLPDLIPQLRAYTVGADAGLNQGNHDYAVVADFDNVDDYLVYRDHPDHQKVIAEHIKPILATRAAVQLSL
ncbi:Dabb family protein [Nonomuraea gerenzanensis]|uniref:Stress responsive A/B Barrel Domain superfamily protein n=1 Tax=Nonomuraea gerenzanensis TaxID=93944 RepID=A0A1M4DVC8_9ACTN|nr:Dabb family protein [Nonomuraea gerenzanensis]UBU12850.1 Dabb family protein [Nonomuraea gerenzanensis]SBO90500.1 stress responsive A/B Barrel Domain superfamily protein [Nonomuraea gerenzanensis]